MEQRGSRAEEYGRGVAALCRVARGYVEAARFDDALTLLRGLEAGLVLPDVPVTARVALAVALADALRWRASLVEVASFAPAAAAGEHAVAGALSSGDPATLAAALLARARVAYHRATQAGEGGLEAAADDAAEALRWAELADSAHTACGARLLAGLVAEREGRFPDAEAVFELVLAEAEAQGFEGERAEALRHLGFAAMRAGHLEQGEAFFADSLAALQRLGVGYALPFAHLSLGELYAQRGDMPASRRQYETGLALAETSGNRRATMQILFNLAEQRAADDPTAARSLLARAAEAARALGHTQGQALIAARLQALDEAA